jgi:hypothetical protein
MKRIYLLSVLIGICAFSELSIAQKMNSNIFGFATGIIPSWENGIYVDFDGNNSYAWYNRKTTLVYNIFYHRKLNPYFSLGGYMEYESSSFEEQLDVSRLNFGTQWMGRFPDYNLNMQLGGFFGAGKIFPENYSSLFGIDYGLMAGPAYEQDNFGVSLQVHAGFGYYFGKKEVETTLLYIPKIFLKVYYTF